MKFQLNVCLNDQDYLDYNVFWMIRSPYGKKQIMTLRMMLVVLFLVFIAIFLYGGGFSALAFWGIVPMLIALLLSQFFLKKFLAWSLKGQIKALKKSGKMGYSAEAFMEFHEEYFSETTPENKTEHKYSVVERVSIVDHKTIYIHVNNVMAYILPLSCFQSKEQSDEFIDFIKTKCAEINGY